MSDGLSAELNRQGGERPILRCDGRWGIQQFLENNPWTGAADPHWVFATVNCGYLTVADAVSVLTAGTRVADRMTGEPIDGPMRVAA